MIGQRSTIRVALLDSNREHVAYEWSFSSLDHDVVRIGRSHENDVVISDVYVSRCHAELQFKEGVWEIRSLGRNGVLFGGRKIEETHALGEAGEFQLGPSGSFIRLSPLDDAESAAATPAALTTVVMDAAQLSAIAVDRMDVSRAVGEIADSDYFRKLREIRQAREADETAEKLQKSRNI
jgi:pSer/pThr/pTyr-binding forkhead associated (FHA) protein